MSVTLECLIIHVITHILSFFLNPATMPVALECLIITHYFRFSQSSYNACDDGMSQTAKITVQCGTINGTPWYRHEHGWIRSL